MWVLPSAEGLTVHPHLPQMGRVGEGRWKFLVPARTRGPSHICAVLFCRRAKRSNLGGSVCSRCGTLLWRLNNPIRCRYNNLRASAKKRKIAFDLSYEDFTAFCHLHRYHETSGTNPGDIQIDRENPLLGYTLANIRPMEMLENSTKGSNADKEAHRRSRYKSTVYVQPELDPNADPF